MVRDRDNRATPAPPIVVASPGRSGSAALVRAADSLGPFETTEALRLYRTALDIARPEERLAILLRQGRVRRLAAEWDDAEADLRATVEVAESLGDVLAEAEATLLIAHVTWDPARWSSTVRSRLVSLLDRVPTDELTVHARLQACLAGGTYQDGTTGRRVGCRRTRPRCRRSSRPSRTWRRRRGPDVGPQGPSR